jgi:cytochrome c oxidase subunit 3
MAKAGVPYEAVSEGHGPEPRAEAYVAPMDHGVLGVWIWLAAECMFFASLIGTFLVERPQLNGGPDLYQVIDLKLTFVGTIILLLSSLTMALGFAAVNRDEVAALRRWLVVTAILGVAFVGAQVVEFTTLYQAHFTYQTSPQSAAFFTLVGFHGLHVAFGVFWILATLAFSFRKEFQAEARAKVHTMGLYWHFVDVVWVVIFSVVYLMGKVG